MWVRNRAKRDTHSLPCPGPKTWGAGARLLAPRVWSSVRDHRTSELMENIVLKGHKFSNRTCKPTLGKIGLKHRPNVSHTNHLWIGDVVYGRKLQRTNKCCKELTTLIQCYHTYNRQCTGASHEKAITCQQRPMCLQRYRGRCAYCNLPAIKGPMCLLNIRLHG